METKPLVNTVAKKPIITLNLEDFFPKEEELALVDMKQFLFKELILREADFREQVDKFDWKAFAGKYVCITCSTEAIIPMWAWMVVSSALSPYAKAVAATTPPTAAEVFLLKNIQEMDVEPLRDRRVVVKGCGDRKISEAAFVEIAQKLAGVAKALMYGEPCSTVPVYRK